MLKTDLLETEGIFLETLIDVNDNQQIKKVKPGLSTTFPQPCFEGEGLCKGRGGKKYYYLISFISPRGMIATQPAHF